MRQTDPMTPSPPPSIGTRVLDVIFGERGTPDGSEHARAAQPPRIIQVAFNFALAVLFALFMLYMAGKSGWLPIDRASVPRWGMLTLSCALLVYQLARLLVERHYSRRVDRARPSDRTRDDQP